MMLVMRKGLFTSKIDLLHGLIFCFFFVAVCSSLPTCRKDETTFTYTECDEDQGRWRVAVPKIPGQCQIESPATPMRSSSCDFSCDAGQFLNLDSQQCEECPVGTYSLGSGVRFDSWETLPNDFTVISESIGFSSYGYRSRVNNCSMSKWKPAGHFVVSNDDDCTSSLSYSVELRQAGAVSFSYQFPDDSIIFHFYVQDGLCQTSRKIASNVFLNTTGTEWKTWKADLKKGPNVLNWKTTGIMIDDQNKLNPVRIRDIEITGVSYATECHKCSPGFYASERGSHWCKPCSPNTRSLSGGSICEPCDPETQYSPLASRECLARPPCKEEDYFATHSACNEKKMTKMTYEWVEPKICDETTQESVELPQSGEEKPCAPCNPGFYPTEKNCLPCPPETYSDGSQNCTRCPSSTAPHYGLFSLWWDFLPDHMKTSCISLTRSNCDQKQGWEAVGDQVRTVSADSGEAYLVLIAALPSGFMEQDDAGVYGTVTFVFQIQCTDDCHFYFMQDIQGKGTDVVNSWRGKQDKRTYTYKATENDTSLSFTWAFQKKHPSDMAQLFVVNITNAAISSADACVSCASGNMQGSSCIPCPTGNYLNDETRTCTPCSGNTKLNPDKTACIECGEGTITLDDHTACAQDCHFVSPSTNRHYDYSKLPSTISTQTLPSFTSAGRKYYHVYNFSLCNNEGWGYAECIENRTYVQSGSYDPSSVKKVKGMACQSTALYIDGSSGERLLVHSQPTLLSTSVESVTQEVKTNDTDVIFPKDSNSDLNDVVYSMSTEWDGSNDCPDGRRTFLHLRCDPTPTQVPVEVEMPKSCPDGTCNGCDFHFLLRSVEACPLCLEDDYLTIVGGCEHGEKITKYLWESYPRKCRGGVKLPEETKEACQDYTFYMEVGIIGGCTVLSIACVMVCCLWKKSRKLEYKYHRLVMNAKGEMSGGNLPPADSCAISDSESDYEGKSDEVIFQQKKARLFEKKKVNDYESVVLQPVSSSGV